MLNHVPLGIAQRTLQSRAMDTHRARDIGHSSLLSQVQMVFAYALLVISCLVRGQARDACDRAKGFVGENGLVDGEIAIVPMKSPDIHTSGRKAQHVDWIGHRVLGATGDTGRFYDRATAQARNPADQFVRLSAAMA
ncbi:hypothetical protein A3839_28345 [Achromobacter insolitus]|nr:hypothetical protein A3839_28345 [Achromobacter insolitus]